MAVVYKVCGRLEVSKGSSKIKNGRLENVVSQIGRKKRG